MTEKYAYYKKMLEKKGIPADQRKLALELYRLGEEEYALDFLIRQMNQYKDPAVHKNIKRETCMATALTLGRLRDRRAIDPLFEGLGEICRFAAAYALAKINGPDVEERLIKLVSLDNKKGLHAIIALGFLNNEKAVPYLIKIMEHLDEYEKRYENDCAFDLVENIILGVLGLYPNNESADAAFRKFISKFHIILFLSDYVHEDVWSGSFIITHEIGWKVVKKYGWDRFIDSEKKRDACEYTTSDKWAEDLRKEIADKIWVEMKREK